jgi:hypothetical protein
MYLFGPIIQLLVLYSANAIMSSEFNNFVELWSCNTVFLACFGHSCTYKKSLWPMHDMLQIARDREGAQRKWHRSC